MVLCFCVRSVRVRDEFTPLMHFASSYFSLYLYWQAQYYFYGSVSKYFHFMLLHDCLHAQVKEFKIINYLHTYTEVLNYASK
jgi:hypothetical protein